MKNTRSGNVRVKELKVILPVETLARLHAMKALHGKLIYESITEALDLYFATHKPPSLVAASDESQADLEQPT